MTLIASMLIIIILVLIINNANSSLCIFKTVSHILETIVMGVGIFAAIIIVMRIWEIIVR